MVVVDMAAGCTHEHKMPTGFVTHRAGRHWWKRSSPMDGFRNRATTLTDEVKDPGA